MSRTALHAQVEKTFLQLMVNRRRLLKTAAVASTIPWGFDLIAGTPPGKKSVAIIGAGLSGLTAAYQLRHVKNLELTLFEASQRTGGRVITKRNFNKDGMWIELGGELVDTRHKAIRALCKELGIGLTDMDKGEVGHDLYVSKGKVYGQKDMLAGFAPMMPKLQADADSLYDAKKEFTAAAEKLDSTPLDEYLNSFRSTTPEWVLQVLATAYECEYGLRLEEQSSLNLIDFIGTDVKGGFRIFGESDERWRVVGGNSSVVEGLEKAAGAKINFNHRMTNISKKGAQIFVSTVADGTPKEQGFDAVIMAVPFTILRKLDSIDQWGLSPDKLQVIREMGYGANSKLMLGFKSKVWRERFPEANGTFYHDLSSQSVWETSRGQSGKSGILTIYVGGKTALEFDPNEQKVRWLAELDSIIPGLKAEFDGNAAASRWNDYEWTLGSYSSAKVGQYRNFFAEAAKSELGGQLIFAGEHTSPENYGFMNGAVDAGQRAASDLKTYLKLS